MIKLNMNSHRIIVFLLCLAASLPLFLVDGCGKKEKQKEVKPVTYAVNKAKQAPVEKEEEKFVYFAKDRRDPFVPMGLVGEAYSKAGTIDIAQLELKGILNSKTEKKRYALISGPGGDRYILKDGALLNLNNKVIKGVKGTIGEDSVTLLTEKHYMRVMKIERPKSDKAGLKMEKLK